MGMVVKVEELMRHLQDNDLVIVHRDQLAFKERVAEEKQKRIVRDLLKLESIGIGDVIRYKLTHIKTYQGLKASTLFRTGEVYKNSTGKHMVLTSAIKRIRNQKNIF